MIPRFLAFLFLLAVLPAQTVRVANNSGAPFHGWIRTTIDQKPPYEAGEVDGCLWVVGRELAPSLWSVDVRPAKLPTATRAEFNLAKSTAAKFTLGPLPNPLAHFGGWPTVGGVALTPISLDTDGAAWSVHLQCRPAPLLVADVWARWYPDQPGMIAAEAVVTASNPAIPDLFYTAPAGGLRFAWGPAWIWSPGGVYDGTLVPAGTRLCDGQCLSAVLSLGWPQYWQDQFGPAQFAAQSGRSVSAVGAAVLASSPPASFDGAAWTGQHLPRAFAHQRVWETPTLGPAANSSQTGAQEDQVWVRGEAFAERSGVGCEQVAYMIGMATARRPCHHREQNGTLADPAAHPGVMFWFSRPHPATNDLLGKPRVPTEADTTGWIGPDREHWLINTTAAGYRLTGSRALQNELRQHAMILLWQETVPSEKPGWSTNGSDAARSAFWVALVAQHLDRNLEDRALADRVLARIGKRVTEVYLPAWGAKPADIWDVRLDARLELAPGRSGSMLWQQAVASYGVWLMGEMTGNAAAKQVALRGAKAAMDFGWQQDATGRWIFWENVAYPKPATYIEHDTAHRTGWYDHTWAVPGLVVIRELEPDNAKANAIWAQIEPNIVPSWRPVR